MNMPGFSHYSLPLLNYITDYSIFVVNQNLEIVESNIRGQNLNGQNIDDVLISQFNVNVHEMKIDLFDFDDLFVKLPIKDTNKTITFLHVQKGLDEGQTLLAIIIENEVNTEKKNRELLKLTQQLNLINQNLEDFAHIVSHDLVAPIRKIKSFGKLLHDKLADLQDDESQFYIKRMAAAADAMEQLINDLLLYSRQTKIVLDKTTLEVHDIINGALETLDMMNNRNVLISNNCTNITIVGVKSQMKQLFENILSNAYKYKKSDQDLHLEMDCDIVVGDQSKDEWAINGLVYHVISIKDNGIGFDNSERHRIFDIFTRLSNVSDTTKGTGIGLAIAKKIMMNHGGFITANGQIEKGAEFKLYFPKS